MSDHFIFLRMDGTALNILYDAYIKCVLVYKMSYFDVWQFCIQS